mgnify:CR=1 FL=1
MSALRPQQRGSIIDAKDLRYFIRIASKNWYFVAVAIVLSSVLSYLYSYKLPDVYGATTQILLKDRDVYDYQSSVYKSLGYTGVYGDIVNQRRVLTSYDLVNTTLDKLDFDVSYFIVGRFKTSQVHGTLPFTVEINGLASKLYGKPFDLRIVDINRYTLSYDRDGVIVTKEFSFDKEERNTDFILTVRKSPYLLDSTLSNYSQTDYQFIRYDRSALVSKFISRMLVVNHDFTTILQVAVEDEVAIRAKQFLDTLSKVYIDYTLKSEVEINENTVRYIDKQLNEVSTILESHEDELQSYKENKQILNLGREETLYFQEMVDYDQQRRKWELEIGAMDALEDYILNSEDERLLPPAVFIADDAFLKASLGEMYAMQMQRNEMMYSATGSNAVIQLFDSTMQLNRLNLLTYLDNSRHAIRTRIADVQKQSNDYEGMIRALPKSQRDVLNIERRLQKKKKMYLFLLEKRASTIIARAGIVPGTKVIEASRSLGVVRPDKTRIFYTFVLGGVIVAMLVVFIRVMFYNRIENADQLKELTPLPIYGEIIASEKAEENYVVVDSDPQAAITESFRTVRTNLEYVPVESGKGKVVMVTSYRPNEAKSFSSVISSASLGKIGKKVLLLELDLHKPKVGVSLGMTSQAGLSNVLIGKLPWKEAIMPTQFENFDVLLAGPTPPNASELVLSNELEKLFTEAKEIYDYIMVDTPPVGLITDAILMMRYMDATLFVLNTRFANKDHVNNAMEVLTTSGGKNSGFILNGVRMKKSKYYYNTNYGYGYRYAYGYGYGYGYGKKNKQAEGRKDKDA